MSFSSLHTLFRIPKYTHLLCDDAIFFFALHEICIYDNECEKVSAHSVKEKRKRNKYVHIHKV